MTAARINIKNIDYFKYKKLIIDANRDDYAVCSKEVQAFCDCVQTMHFRDEEFDDEHDRGRFMEIHCYYKQILISKRIDPIDMRIKSGWWGEHKNAYSAGKLKPAVLREKLILKTSDYNSRHGNPLTSTEEINEKLDGPGLYVLKHKEHQCFQYVGKADKIILRVSDKLKAAFEGSSQEPLSALLIISMCGDWDFYFTPVASTDGDEVLRILENDLILKHDSIWPHGLNFRLHIDSLFEVSEFRKSCQRHHWPPDGYTLEDEEININKIRKGLEWSAFEPIFDVEPVIAKGAAAKSADKKKPKEMKKSKEITEDIRSLSPDPVSVGHHDLLTIERPTSPSEMSTLSSSTFVVVNPIEPIASPTDSEKTIQVVRPTSAKKPTTPRPTSVGKRSARAPVTPRGGSAAADKAKPVPRPTTPKKTTRPKSGSRPVSSASSTSQNGTPDLSPEDVSLALKADDATDGGDLERSQSGSSLSSVGSKRHSRDAGPNSPAKSTPVKSPRSRPTSAKKQDRSRLPVSYGAAKSK